MESGGLKIVPKAGIAFRHDFGVCDADPAFSAQCDGSKSHGHPVIVISGDDRFRFGVASVAIPFKNLAVMLCEHDAEFAQFRL